jgi:hypothetical protein
MGKAWSDIIIRRTYVSPDPRFPDKKVGDSITGLYIRRIICSFKGRKLDIYEAASMIPLSRLIIKLQGDKLAWNRKYSYILILLSTWLGWELIYKDFMAERIKL